jgi:ribosomal protein S20
MTVAKTKNKAKRSNVETYMKQIDESVNIDTREVLMGGWKRQKTALSQDYPFWWKHQQYCL